MMKGLILAAVAAAGASAYAVDNFGVVRNQVNYSADGVIFEKTYDVALFLDTSDPQVDQVNFVISDTGFSGYLIQESPGRWATRSPRYDTQDEMEGLWPFSVYTFETLSGGTQLDTGQIDDLSPSWSIEPEFVDATAFQNLDVTRDYRFEWNEFVNPEPNATVAFQIFGPNGLLFSDNLGVAARGYDLAAGRLEAGQTYTASLIFTNFVGTPSGFGGAPGTAFHQHFTEVRFSTVPEPATMTALSLGLLALLKRRRSG